MAATPIRLGPLLNLLFDILRVVFFGVVGLFGLVLSFACVAACLGYVPPNSRPRGDVLLERYKDLDEWGRRRDMSFQFRCPLCDRSLPSPRYHLACNEFEVACIECFDEMVADVRPSDGLPLCPGSDCGKPLQSKLNIAQASFDKWIAQEKKSPSWKWDPNYPYHDRSVSTGKAIEDPDLTAKPHVWYGRSNDEVNGWLKTPVLWEVESDSGEATRERA